MKSRSGTDCSRLMFLDIETIPDFSRIHLFGIPDPPEILQREDCPEPAHFILGPTGTKPKDKLELELKELLEGERVPHPDWISDCIDVEENLGKQRSTVVKLLNTTLNRVKSAFDESEKMLSACSVDPHKCRILSLGWAIGDGPVEVAYADLAGDDESKDEQELVLLSKFWEAAEQSTRFCGYNIHGFDIPVLLVRSAYLAIQPLRQINMSKYTGDLLDMFILMGERGKLKDILRYNQIGQEYEDGMHGGKVLDLWREGQHRKIEEYQILDVENERELFRHFSGYFWE